MKVAKPMSQPLPAYAPRGLASLAEVEDPKSHILVAVDLRRPRGALVLGRLTEVRVNPDPAAGDIYQVRRARGLDGRWRPYY